MKYRNWNFALALVALIVLERPQLCSAQPLLNLPAGPLTKFTTPGVTVTDTNTVPATFFTVTFHGTPPGLSITNASYLGWCPDFFGDFSLNGSSTPYTLYSSYDSTLPLNAQSPNWDKVSWLLNNKPTGSQSTWIVQQVIWRLLANQYGAAAAGYPLPQPATDNLYNAAITQGTGFVPGVGQTVGVLMYIDGIYPSSGDVTLGLPPNGQVNKFQEILIEVPVPPQGAIGDYVLAGHQPQRRPGCRRTRNQWRHGEAVPGCRLHRGSCNGHNRHVSGLPRSLPIHRLSSRNLLGLGRHKPGGAHRPDTHSDRPGHPCHRQ